MGMFTTIERDDGKSFQIKAGGDQCGRFRAGDRVVQRPSLLPGDMEMEDGVWEGVCDQPGDNEEVWVVISRGTVAAIYPIVLDQFREDDESPRNATWRYLMKQCDIRPPHPAAWTDEQWAAVAKARFRAEYRAAVEGPENFTRTMLRRHGFTRELLGMNPEPSTADEVGEYLASVAAMGAIPYIRLHDLEDDVMSITKPDQKHRTVTVDTRKEPPASVVMRVFAGGHLLATQTFHIEV